MSNTITLDIEERTQGQNPRQIRANGNLPITIYGKGMDSVSAQINTHETFYQRVSLHDFIV